MAFLASVLLIASLGLGYLARRFARIADRNQLAVMLLEAELADSVAPEETELGPRRREVAVFACDLRGFNEFVASSSPQDVHRVLTGYFDVVSGAIARHGGTACGSAGHRLIALFNDPVPCPEPALRALTMATEIQEAVGKVFDRWRLRGHDLGLGVGIALGSADICTVGLQGRSEFCAVGAAVNLASNLCDEARAGENLIDQRAHATVQRGVRVEDSALISLDGHREPALAIGARLIAAAEDAVAS